MKIEQLLTEHKKGVKAVKYTKKPKPLVGPEALKAKEKQKAHAAKPEVKRHKNLVAKKPAAKTPDPMGEAKRPDRPLPKTDLKVGDDVVADTSKEDYPGGHKERRGKVTRVGEKGVHIKTDDNDEHEWHPYKIVKKHSVAEGKIKINIKKQPETAQEKLYKKHQELRKKSGLPDPSEYKKKAAEKQKEIDDMKEAKQPEAPKPRNFVAKNAKTAGAGAHKDAKKAAKEVRGQKHKNKEMAENAMGKVVDYKPGVSATIDTGPGMTTMLDLKKNPTSLTKDPQTGKLKLMPGTAATAQPSATTQSTVKPGDQVEMPKTNTMAAEDILRLAGLR
jgi:hypothetical protein